MFFLCLCGFSLATLAVSHKSKNMHVRRFGNSKLAAGVSVNGCFFLCGDKLGACPGRYPTFANRQLGWAPATTECRRSGSKQIGWMFYYHEWHAAYCTDRKG